MQIYQVNPWDVTVNDIPSKRDVDKQMSRLCAEGQIEPIVVRNMIPDLDEYPYADAQVIAARQLRWATILVTY